MKALVLASGTMVVVACILLFVVTWLPKAIDMIEGRQAEITSAMEQ